MEEEAYKYGKMCEGPCWACEALFRGLNRNDRAVIIHSPKLIFVDDGSGQGFRLLIWGSLLLRSSERVRFLSMLAFWPHLGLSLRETLIIVALKDCMKAR